MDSLQQVNRNWGFRYSNSVEKTLHVNSELYMDSFRKKIQEKLIDFEAQSEIQNDTIKFKRIVKMASDCGYSRAEAMQILREGEIRIEKIDSKRIRISWEVQLDTLIFLSMVIGFVIGLLVGFASSMTNNSIIFGIFFALIIGTLFSISTYFIGCSLIKSQIDRIVETSI